MAEEPKFTDGERISAAILVAIASRTWTSNVNAERLVQEYVDVLHVVREQIPRVE